MGSIVAQADCSGNRTAINDYDEYGIPASGNLGRFGYTGQTWVPEIGLWYYKTRMYSPTLGRFMQTDPIGYADGMNWYNYVGSDPVNYVDPLGLKCDTYNNGIIFRDESAAACNEDGDQEQTLVSGNRGPHSSIFISSGGTTWFDDRLWMADPEPDTGYVLDAPQGDNGSCAHANSTAAAVAEWANSISAGAGAVAGISAGLRLVTAPTGAGFVAFETVAGGALLVSTVASGVGLVANVIDENWEGASFNAVGLFGGSLVGGVASKSFQSSRTFGDLSAGQVRQVRFLGTGPGNASGSAAALLGCQ